MQMVFTSLNTVINVFILLSGVILLKFFAKRKVNNDSYKPAVIIYLIWIIILYLGLSIIFGFISSFYISLDPILITSFNTLQGIVAIAIEIFIISSLVKIFYKSQFNDSIFITIQVVAIQSFMRIIVANVLAIIFNLTTGGFAFFYVFQY